MSYARGQETFVGRVVLTVRNLFRLFFASLLLACLCFCLMAWFRLPVTFWTIQHAIFVRAKAHIDRTGIDGIKTGINWLLRSTQNHIANHDSILVASCQWSIAFGALAFFVLFWIFHSRGRKMMNPDHKRGARLISSDEFNREFAGIIKQEVKEIRQDSLGLRRRWDLSPKNLYGSPFVCSADGLKLPEYALYRHLSVVGATGVGKSTLIKSYLEHCRNHKEKVIIPDINGEYASEFFQDGDKILSLFDPMTSYWSFSAEEEINPAEFAAFLVPSGDDRNAFWWKGARQVVSQLLANAESPQHLWDQINSPENDLTGTLTGLPRKIAGKEGSPQAAGITGSSLLDLGFLEHLNYWPRRRGDESPISLYSWAQDTNPNWIFITFSDTDRELMGPLLRLWLNTAILGVLRRQEGTGVPVNLVVDELATVGKIELLTRSLERARKYRGKVVLGYQSESQLAEIYGRNWAASIRANTGTKFIFRCPDASEAKDLSTYLGSEEVSKRNIGTAYGSKTPAERENISEQETLRNIVLDSEIRDLPDGHFYLKSLNVNPVKSRVLKKRWPKKHVSDFVFPPSESSSFAKPSNKEKSDDDENLEQDFEIDSVM